MGAGLDIAVAHDLGEISISDTTAGLAVTLPVAIYLITVWALHLRHRHTPRASVAFPVVAAGSVASTWLGAPAVITAGLLAVMVTITVVTSRGPAAASGPRIPLLHR